MEAKDVFNQLWIEKYRPKTLNDVVLNTEQKEFFERCLQRNDIPHLLMYGPPGSGKTTCARIFVKQLVHNSMDILNLNGSDTNGIDFFRNTVIEFCKTPAISSAFKICFIDESDGITPQTQALLRNAMETYAKNVRFILTCNYVYKIIDPLQSRCTSFEMKTMPVEFVQNFVKKILTNENVKFDENDVETVVKALIPDVRKIVNKIQQNCIDGKLKKIKAEDLVSTENKITGLIIELCDSIGTPNLVSVTNKVYPTLLDILKNEKGIELNKVYDTLFDHVKLPAWAKIVVNKYANTHMVSFSQPYNFMAMVYEITQTGIQFVKTFSVRK